MYDAFARQMIRQRRPLALEAFLPRIFSAAAAAAASCACVSACEKARELKLQLFEDGTLGGHDRIGRTHASLPVDADYPTKSVNPRAF
jgi:hypothetical protein